MPSPARRAARPCWRRSSEGNLFLVPLDDRRRWYRYHQLFADVLRAHLLDEQPELRARAPPAGERLVREERRPVRGHPPRDGRRRRRAGGGPGRAGDPGDEPASTGGHAAPVARGAPRRGAPRATGPEQRVCRVTPRAGRGRGRRGAPAGRRAVARRDGRGRRSVGRASGLDGRRRRGGVPPTAGLDRRPPGRPGPDPGRRGRRRGPCPAGARPRRRRRPPRTGRRRRAPRRSPTGRPAISRPRAAWYATGMASLEKAGHLSDVIGCALALADIRLAQGRLGEAHAHLRAGLGARHRTRVAGAAGCGGHARRDQRHPPRAGRPRGRPAAPVRGRGAGRGERPAPEPLPVARRPGGDPAGRRRPGRGTRAAHRGRAASTSATSPPMCARSPP